ncbi:MAG: hypothetical protein ACREV2_04260 [Burkholderiales bacterium]
MLHKYSAIAIALFGLGIQNASAGNEQAQRMIQGGSFVGGTTLPAALTYKPQLSGQDQARALLAPVFVSGGYVGASTTVAVDGHEQARRMIVGQ